MKIVRYKTEQSCWTGGQTRAEAFGVYPSSAAAFSTLRRILSETDARSVNARDTAERKTLIFEQHS